MTYGTIEYQGDKKRLEQSLLISSLFWLLFFVILALVPIRSTPPAEPTMNPVYIELAAAADQEAEPVREPTASASQTAASQTAASQTAAAAASTRFVAAPQATTPETAAAVPTAAAAALAPAAASSKAATSKSSPYQSRGGEDPFTPLSEADLAAASPESQTLPAASSQITSASARSSVVESQKSTASSTDSLSGRIKNVTDSLDSRTPATTGSVETQENAATNTTGGRGPIGAFDFGDGPGRRLLSAPQPAIPARLLEGQPSLIETTVRFRIDKGGAVIALSIQFDPPLPLDIAEYLKTYVFSRWVFSSSNSDGQVRFKYSINIQ